MFKISKFDTATKIGSLFTMGSIVLMATIIMPIIAVLPGILIEHLSSLLVDNDPYRNVGRLSVAILSVLFLAAIILGYNWFGSTIKKRGNVSQRRIILIMTILYFLVHPLGFYAYWGLVLNFRSDGQLIFAVFVTYPFTSLSFIGFGYLLDKLKKHSLRSFYSARLKSDNGG